MPSQHDHVANLVDDFVHDLLPFDEAARVERHCAACRHCADALFRARRRHSLLQALSPAEPSSQLIRATLDRIDFANQPSSFHIRLGVGVVVSLAATIVLLACTHLYYANLKPNSLDLTLLGQSELLASTTAAMRVRLVDQKSHMPLAGVPVVMTLRGPDGPPTELANFTTDNQGSGGPQLDLPDWPDGTYRLEVSARTPAGPETLTRDIRLKRSWKILLSSDKPVYQPGQKILLRALSLRRPDLKPVTGANAVFTLTDPRGNVLFKHTQPTSAYGIASAECELAHEIQEGTYAVRCDVGGTESQLSVEIRRYVLPKFKVTLQPDRPYFALGTKANIRLQADYFFGKPVGKARLDFEVTTEGGQLIANGHGATAADGSAMIDVAIPSHLTGRPEDDGDARLVVTALVTDSAGQKQVASTDLLVTARPIRVRLLPSAGQFYTFPSSNTVFVLVTRADGTPLGNVKVKITGDGVEDEVTTGVRGVASFVCQPTSSGQVNLNLRVTDAAGEELARATERFASGQLLANDFLFTLDRAVYKGGQTMKLSAAGGGDEPLFVDLLKDGQTLLSRTVEMQRGEGELQFDIPQDLFGTLQVVAYMFRPSDGVPLRKSRVVYVAPPNSLQVKATLNQEEYRPGKEAKLQLRLLDEQGTPTPGAVSLSAVDEAVFAVLSRKPGQEKTFYNLDQELLQPVFSLYPWRPEADTEAALRDQALFTRTLRTFQGPMAAEAAPHTLAVRSLPLKEQQTNELRRDRLNTMERAWVVLLLTSLLCGYVAMWVCVPAIDVLKMHAIGLVGLVFIAAFAFVFLGTARMRWDATGFVMEPTAEAKIPQREEAPNVMMFRQSGPTLPRVRKDFPETLLWKPELITDDDGKLPPLSIPLADSITTWRLSASAVSADGRLGATQLPIKVLQPFFVDVNLPVSLTRGDEVGVPVVVYNYLDKPQTVTLTLSESEWFTLEGKPSQTISLAPGEVRSTRFMLKAKLVGTRTLKVLAQAGEVGDAVERLVEVIPDGKRVEFAYGGNLATPANHTLHVPADAIEGSVKAFVKVYPTGFSQLVEGLENIFQMPSGCFEQTSSTTYPNILALDYLRRNNLSVPAVEAKSRRYIHLGYQRLVGFEVAGGGFDWYGRPPANVVLTAYGLMEFVDMARVHDVDPKLIERTRSWLVSQRRADGTWEPDGRGGHLAGAQDRLATTAYVTWALGAQQDLFGAARSLEFLLSHRPADIAEPHTLALVCHAIHALDPNNKDLPAYYDRLAALAKKTEGGREYHWSQATGANTLLHGAGVAGQVETTALAALALSESKRYPEVVRGALAWVVAKKDPHGTWYSTQPTVMALKALLAGGSAGGETKERRVVVGIGKHSEEIAIPADQAEVLRLIDVSNHLSAGENRVRLSEKSGTGVGYQVVFRYHLPEANVAAVPSPLTITINYNRNELSVGEAVKAKAIVVSKEAAPMVIIDLPIPPGFAAETAEFQALVDAGTIARFQVLPRGVLVYLRGLEAGAKLEVVYTLRATMPVHVAAAGGRVYEYYNPKKAWTSVKTRFVVRPAS